MSETILREMQRNIKIMKNDVAEIKAALLDDTGKLRKWAKERFKKGC